MTNQIFKKVFGWTGAFALALLFLFNHIVLGQFMHYSDLGGFLYVTVRWPLMIFLCLVHLVGAVTCGFGAIKQARPGAFAQFLPLIVPIIILYVEFEFPDSLVSW